MFALHLHAFWFLMATVTMVGVTWFEPVVWLALLAMPLYAALAFRRVYGGNSGLLLLRAAVLMAAHSALVLLIVAVSALAALVL